MLSVPCSVIRLVGHESVINKHPPGLYEVSKGTVLVVGIALDDGKCFLICWCRPKQTSDWSTPRLCSAKHMMLACMACIWSRIGCRLEKWSRDEMPFKLEKYRRSVVEDLMGMDLPMNWRSKESKLGLEMWRWDCQSCDWEKDTWEGMREDGIMDDGARSLPPGSLRSVLE